MEVEDNIECDGINAILSDNEDEAPEKQTEMHIVGGSFEID